MLRTKAISSIQEFSFVRMLVLGILIGGTFAVGYTIVKFGLIAGVVFALVPAALCILFITMRNPAIAMLVLFVVNYLIMALTRYVPDLPFGTILDSMIGYTLLMVAFKGMYQRINWKNAATGLTLVGVIWTVYCTLELANPESESIAGWIGSFRSIALNFLLLPFLTQILLDEFRYLKYILFIWTGLTLLAVGKACIQKYFGFNASEMHWLYVLGGRTTHIIQSGTRYFSFFSDAANYGASMGLSMVVFSISAIYFRNPWIRLYLLLVAAAACYGMLISGTRSALAVVFVGYAVFLILSRNTRLIITGTIVICTIFTLLKFTNIGQGNAIIRRTRSAFNADDKSMLVRFENQRKLRELMVDKPFGVGLGHGGGKALRYVPNSPLAQIPTDSWFVMIWVETGIVGLILHLLILIYILLHGGWLVMFRLKHPQVKGLTAALVAGMAGIIVMSYANEIFGQIPTGTIMYMSAGFIFLSPLFDKEMLNKEKNLQISPK